MGLKHPMDPVIRKMALSPMKQRAQFGGVMGIILHHPIVIIQSIDTLSPLNSRE
ncbi:MAG: hypothetical protein BWY82_02833 [Verrucomicrobia bacterium ADurb.Bin474]|nr:MAG: hypothetical protein BWY82_02833 [Verrucomicrobia bacterium ADurb.Bin474]